MVMLINFENFWFRDTAGISAAAKFWKKVCSGKCQEQSVPKISTLRNCIQCLAIIMYTPTNE